MVAHLVEAQGAKVRFLLGGPYLLFVKIKISQLRKVIHDTIAESYGWPVEKEDPVYGIPGENLEAEAPRDPANTELKLPKGRNSRTPVENEKENC